jgi:hypothetical protein
MFATSDENVGAITKTLRVQGRFRCVDTTAEELRDGGFESDPNSRFQFELRVLDLPETVYGSVETINELAGGATVSRAAIALPAFMRQAKSAR